jgi:hypothetical protein
MDIQIMFIMLSVSLTQKPAKTMERILHSANFVQNFCSYFPTIFLEVETKSETRREMFRKVYLKVQP